MDDAVEQAPPISEEPIRVTIEHLRHVVRFEEREHSVVPEVCGQLLCNSALEERVGGSFIALDQFGYPLAVGTADSGIAAEASSKIGGRATARRVLSVDPLKHAPVLEYVVGRR